MSETNIQLFPGVFRSTQGGSNPDFFLHSSGRVGIGNDAPGDIVPPGSSSGTFKLNVTGHANVSGTMQANKYYGDGSTLSGVAAVIAGYWDLDQANNNIKYDIGNVGIGGVASSTNELKVHGTVEATDKVGIGAVDPSHGLVIRKNTDTLLLESENAGAQQPVNIDFKNYDTQDPVGARISVIDDAVYGSHLTFHTKVQDGNDATSAITEKVRIQSNGNVGIGTTNADKAKLQINNTLALLNPSYKTSSDDDQLAGKIEFYLGGAVHELSTPVAGIEGYDKYDGGSFAGALAFKVHGGEKMRIHSNGNVGIGGAVGTEKLKVYGDILATANVTAYSDRRLKSDIVKIKDALNKIDKLNGYTYTMNDKRSTGLIAQEVLEVLPEAVEGSEETTYALAYGNLASIFVEAIKELREKVLDLENKIQN